MLDILVHVNHTYIAVVTSKLRLATVTVYLSYFFVAYTTIPTWTVWEVTTPTIVNAYFHVVL